MLKGPLVNFPRYVPHGLVPVLSRLKRFRGHPRHFPWRGSLTLPNELPLRLSGPQMTRWPCHCKSASSDGQRILLLLRASNGRFPWASGARKTGLKDNPLRAFSRYLHTKGLRNIEPGADPPHGDLYSLPTSGKKRLCIFLLKATLAGVIHFLFFLRITILFFARNPHDLNENSPHDREYGLFPPRRIVPPQMLPTAEI